MISCLLFEKFTSHDLFGEYVNRSLQWFSSLFETLEAFQTSSFNPNTKERKTKQWVEWFDWNLNDKLWNAIGFTMGDIKLWDLVNTCNELVCVCVFVCDKHLIILQIGCMINTWILYFCSIVRLCANIQYDVVMWWHLLNLSAHVIINN